MPVRKKTKFDVAVANMVLAIRYQKGFSQEYLAGILQLNTSFIGQVESPNHPSKYNLNHLNKLAHEMGCSPKDFLPDEAIIEDTWDEDE